MYSHNVLPDEIVYRVLMNVTDITTLQALGIVSKQFQSVVAKITNDNFSALVLNAVSDYHHTNAIFKVLAVYSPTKSIMPISVNPMNLDKACHIGYCVLKSNDITKLNTDLVQATIDYLKGCLPTSKKEYTNEHVQIANLILSLSITLAIKVKNNSGIIIFLPEVSCKKNIYVNAAGGLIANLKLDNKSLKGMNMQNVSFFNITLSNSNLEDANLDGAIVNFSNIDLCNLSNVTWKQGKINNANFFECNLTNSYFCATSFLNSKIITPVLNHEGKIILTGANIVDPVMSSSKIKSMTITSGIDYADYLIQKINSEYENLSHNCQVNLKMLKHLGLLLDNLLENQEQKNIKEKLLATMNIFELISKNPNIAFRDYLSLLQYKNNKNTNFNFFDSKQNEIINSLLVIAQEEEQEVLSKNKQNNQNKS